MRRQREVRLGTKPSQPRTRRKRRYAAPKQRNDDARAGEYLTRNAKNYFLQPSYNARRRKSPRNGHSLYRGRRETRKRAEATRKRRAL
jgi:hypothetical protein